MEESYSHKRIHPIWNVMIYKEIYSPILDEEEFIQECANHYESGEPAERIIAYTNRYFTDDSGLAVGVGETLACGIEYLSLEKNALICDTLKTNLYCVLLLEAMGQAVSDENASNLTSLIDKYSNNFANVPDTSELSGALSKCPGVLKELFAVPKKEQKNAPYQIATRYPKLFWLNC